MKSLSAYPSARRQQGAALLVVLLLLLVMTLLGLASMRGAIMQERMASHTTGRGMAFQVAEAGLRQAEIIARDGVVTFPASGCSAGRCKSEAWIGVTNFWGDGGSGYAVGTAVDVGPTSISPRYVIEDYGRSAVIGGSTCIDLSKPCIESPSQNVFRITSYARAPNGAEVILQSIYRR